MSDPTLLEMIGQLANSQRISLDGPFASPTNTEVQCPRFEGLADLQNGHSLPLRNRVRNRLL
jgi:hypothetical protein